MRPRLALAAGLLLLLGGLPAGAEPAPTRYAAIADLARLPWFGLAPDGALVVKDPAIGPIVDCHTHLAQTIGPQHQPDLARKTARVRHYLAADGPFDLAPYANLNFGPEGLHALEHDLAAGALAPGGMRETHTAPNLRADMDRLGVSHAVLLPIDMPLGSDNAGRWLAASRGVPGLIPFGSVHPYAPFPALKLAAQQAAGVRGIKVHPAVQLVAPEDPQAMALYRRCGERKLPVFWHCGPVGIETPLGRTYSQVRRYEAPIRAYPGTTFVLGHAGALQPDEALRLARTYPNVWLELSSQGLPEIRRILRDGPADRIVFGSDWPFYHQALPLAKVLLATEGRPALRRAVLYDNAARLLGLAPRPTAEGTRHPDVSRWERRVSDR